MGVAASQDLWWFLLTLPLMPLPPSGRSWLSPLMAGVAGLLALAAVLLAPFE